MEPAGSDNSRGVVGHGARQVREPDLAWRGLILRWRTCRRSGSWREMPGAAASRERAAGTRREAALRSACPRRPNCRPLSTRSQPRSRAMLRLVMLLAGLRGLLASGLGEPNGDPVTTVCCGRFFFSFFQRAPACVTLWPNSVKTRGSFTVFWGSFALSPWKSGCVRPIRWAREVSDMTAE